MKTVLVVEDDQSLYGLWGRQLNGKGIVLRIASSISCAEKLFEEGGLDAIAMDGCVPGKEMNTGPLVTKFKETFKGPIIAMSSDLEFREALLKLGCTHECERKVDLHRVLLKVLGA